MVSATVSNPAGDIVETYTYDYLGNRTSKTSNGVTTKFTTDLSSGYAQVLKAEKDSEVTYYTRGFELISKTTNGESVFYLYDGGSSVRALTDESGAVTDTLVFDAFGNETEKTGTTENSYGFQGEEQDSTGLYYLRARYMNPSTGMFTSMDTYGGSLTDPMSLHKYLFANSNPVKYCDPSGHSSLTLTEGMGVCAIIGALSGVDCYVLGFVRGDDDITAGGIILSAVIGAAIAVAIYLGIYLISQLIISAITAGALGSSIGAIAKEAISKVISSGLISSMEYEAVWGITSLRDISNGTDKSSSFSVLGISSSFLTGAILGLLGFGTDKGLVSMGDNVIVQFGVKIDASLVAAACYYGAYVAYENNYPSFVSDALNIIGGYCMSVVTNGGAYGSGGSVEFLELMGELLGVSYDVEET